VLVGLQLDGCKAQAAVDFLSPREKPDFALAEAFLLAANAGSTSSHEDPNPKDSTPIKQVKGASPPATAVNRMSSFLLTQPRPNLLTNTYVSPRAVRGCGPSGLLHCDQAERGHHPIFPRLRGRPPGPPNLTYLTLLT
jgi:hypothetical protein